MREKRCGEVEGSEWCSGEKAFAFKRKAVCWPMVHWGFVLELLQTRRDVRLFIKFFFHKQC